MPSAAALSKRHVGTSLPYQRDATFATMFPVASPVTGSIHRPLIAQLWLLPGLHRRWYPMIPEHCSGEF